jgi:uncharacterized RDD family membrane protein YckC
VLVALVVGYLNTSLIEPYTTPRATADDTGAFLFYDAAEHVTTTERSFLLRRSTDGVHFDKAQRVEGQLRSVALLSDEHLVALFPDFLSVYARPRGLEREWSTASSADAIGFDADHVARLRGRLYAFGTQSKDGALRAARLEDEMSGARRAWRLAALDARVEKAAESPGPEATERNDDGTPIVPPPVAWSSAEDADGKLALFFRVQSPRPHVGLVIGEAFPGVVRLARFDGTSFVGSEVVTLEDDLAAFAAVAVKGDAASVGTEVHVFGARRADPEAKIFDYVLRGSRLEQVDAIPYKKGGLLEDRPAAHLAAFAEKGRIALFAQVGGSIRVAMKEGGHWRDWEDMARTPPEALGLVYLYIAGLLLLGAVMIVAGLWVLKERLTRGRGIDLDEATADRFVAEALGRGATAAEPLSAAREPEGQDEDEDATENDAPIHDRVVAFLIDLAIVCGILSVVHSAFQIELSVKPGEDPTRDLALFAWATLALLAYLTLCEAIFGRTPGKRLLGLEVKTTDGKTPSLVARLYRNLFRIELIFMGTVVQVPPLGSQPVGTIWIPMIALAVMLATPRAQRPGDLVAGTVVQRSRSARPPAAAAAAAEEEEESQA